MPRKWSKKNPPKNKKYTDEQWGVARRLRVEQGFRFPSVARITGIHNETLKKRAKMERWPSPDAEEFIIDYADGCRRIPELNAVEGSLRLYAILFMIYILLTKEERRKVHEMMPIIMAMKAPSENWRYTWRQWRAYQQRRRIAAAKRREQGEENNIPPPLPDDVFQKKQNEPI